MRLEEQQSTLLSGWQPIATRPAGTASWTGVAPGFSVLPGTGSEVRVLAPGAAVRLFLRLAAVVE